MSMFDRIWLRAPGSCGRGDDAASRRDVLVRAAAGLVTILLPDTASADAPALLSFDHLYESLDVLVYEPSETVRGLAGQQVLVRGYIAPPLKPANRFFVLTRQPVALCPFCQSDADWPLDIIIVYLQNASPMVSGGEAVMVRGKLDLGSWTDPETRFVSQIRIIEAAFRKA
jgi:hypothetical protein